MAWPIRLLEERPTDRFPATGEAWPLPEGQPFTASPSFRRRGAGKRRPLVVKMPDEVELLLDAPTSLAPAGYSVTLEGGVLSVDGLVETHRGWAGYIRNGEVRSQEEQQRLEAQGEAQGEAGQPGTQQPAPTQPAPTQPTPAQPTPTQPAPAPTPTQPAPTPAPGQ